MIFKGSRCIFASFCMIVACTPTWVVAETLTGIYVEYYQPPTGNNCNSSPASSGDGWFAVPGFPDRGSTCPGRSAEDGLPSGSSVTFEAASGKQEEHSPSMGSIPSGLRQL